MSVNVLREGLSRLGFEENEFFGIKTRAVSELEELMSRYTNELLKFNARFDLVSDCGYETAIVRHVLDSLSAAKLIAKIASEILKKRQVGKLTIADIGSGAGLPGIPLAAAFENMNFVLVERMTKRCEFLEHCLKTLCLSNAKIQNEQVERLAQNSFDVAVMRAFHPLTKKTSRVLLRIIKAGGKLAAYKAKSERIAEEMASLSPNIPEYTTEKLTVPFLTDDTPASQARERNLLIITK